MADVYSQGMISVLDDLRRRKVLTDAEVLCTEDGARFSVHRALLHAACPLFRESPSALAAGVTAVAAAEDATSSPCAAYPVDNIRGPVMAALLQFVYTNKVALSSENVLDMLLAAQRFQVRCGRTLVKDPGLWSESAESDKVQREDVIPRFSSWFSSRLKDSHQEYSTWLLPDVIAHY